MGLLRTVRNVGCGKGNSIKQSYRVDVRNCYDGNVLSDERSRFKSWLPYKFVNLYQMEEQNKKEVIITNLGKALKERRIQLGLSMRDVEDVLNVNLYRIESGKTDIRFSTLAALCDHYQVVVAINKDIIITS